MSNIFKYSDFIKEEYDPVHSTRTTSIELKDDESIMSYLMDTVPWYFEDIDNITPIYRGIYGNTTSMRYHNKDGNIQKLLTIDPSKHKRYARNTESYYIAMMDESHYWSEYPKRSNSIICSTDYTRAKAYGAVYRVIPLKENSKFSLCSAGDVFYSFDYLFKKLKSMGFDFGGQRKPAIPALNDLIVSLGGQHEEEEITRDAMANSLNIFQMNLDEKEEYDEEEWKYADMIKDFVKEYIEGDEMIGDLYDEIEQHMSPDDNGFELIEYGRSTKLPQNREIYTDSECLMVLESSLRDAL